MNTPAGCSLTMIHARDCDKTVIFRRGPSKFVRCILWDRETDHFEDGQWLKGPVHVMPNGLSPDGTYMIYATHRYSGPREEAGEYSYVVLSRPPWFTALALYPYTLFGGFIDATRYMVHYRSDVADAIGKAPELRRVVKVEDTDDIVSGLRHTDGSRVHLDAKDRDFLTGAQILQPPDDIHTEGGRLYRKGEEGLELIRDFSAMRFEPIRAPYDWRTGNDDTPWHPRDAEDR